MRNTHNPQSLSRTSSRAFSLIEMMVVLGILVLVLAIVIPAVNAARTSARKAATLQTLAQGTANRPKTDEAIAMFIDDEKALWRLTRDARVMRIEFPTRDLGNRTAVFEVGGLERAKMPKWD